MLCLVFLLYVICSLSTKKCKVAGAFENWWQLQDGDVAEEAKESEDLSLDGKEGELEASPLKDSNRETDF